MQAWYHSRNADTAECQFWKSRIGHTIFYVDQSCQWKAIPTQKNSLPITHFKELLKYQSHTRYCIEMWNAYAFWMRKVESIVVINFISYTEYIRGSVSVFYENLLSIRRFSISLLEVADVHLTWYFNTWDILIRHRCIFTKIFVPTNGVVYASSLMLFGWGQFESCIVIPAKRKKDKFYSLTW